jgi:hypothetical protein
MRTIMRLLRVAPDYIVQNLQKPTACEDAFILKPMSEKARYDCTSRGGMVVYCKDGAFTDLTHRDFVAVYSPFEVSDFEWAVDNGMIEFATYICSINKFYIGWTLYKKFFC